MKVMNFISDDEIGYEDENFYPIEYDDDVDYVGDVNDTEIGRASCRERVFRAV